MGDADDDARDRGDSRDSRELRDFRDGAEAGLDPERTDLRAEGIALVTERRTLFASIALYAPLGYAGAVVVRDGAHSLWLRVVIAATPLFALRALSPRVDDLPSARTATRVALVCALLAGTLTAGLGLRTPLAAISALFACATGVAAVLATVDAIAGLGGLFPARPETRTARRVVRALLAFVWIVAATVEATRALAALGRVPTRIITLVARPFFDPALAFLDAAAVTFAIVYVVQARRARRFELGALERHDLLLGSAALSLPITIFVASSLDPTNAFALEARPLVLLVAPALALVVGSLVAQLVRDPITSGAIVARSWIALIFGLVAWVTVELALPTARSGVVALVATVAGLGVGLAAPSIARRFGLPDPYVETIRRAIARTREATAATDLHDVERGTLGAVRALAGRPLPSSGAVTPRLLTFSPLREVVIDAAGEPRGRDPSPLHDGTGEQDPDAPSPVTRVVPPALLSLLVSEPLGVVRSDVLRALEVRRADLRPALAWCDRNDAVAVVALLTDGELEGLLVLPRGREVENGVGLLYARALRAIARTLSPRIALETALARAAARTRKAEQRARDVDHLLERAAEREARMSAALARSGGGSEHEAGEVVGYAPAARQLRAQLDALARAPAHLLVLHRPGTDPSTYAARLHRASGRRGALHVVDASRREAQTPQLWRDPKRSPLELARDGTLLVRSAHRLPAEVQKSIVSALAFREGPSGDPLPLDLRVVLAIPSDSPEDDESYRVEPTALEASLLGRMHEPALRVPRLSRRVEDLRALALDRLAALGVARADEPLGLAEDALAILVEHEWPGDDAELDAVLFAAAARAEGPRVTAADVRASLPARPAT